MNAIIMWILSKIGDTAFGELVKKVLEKRFPKLFKDKTKEIVDIYEHRIEEKNTEIVRLEKERLEQQQQHQQEEGRLMSSLKRRSIAVDKLLEQYHKPLNAIIISYATQREQVSGKNRQSHFLKNELARYNSKYLGGTDVLIPPASVPAGLKTQEDLKRWFEIDILKNRYCKIKFLVLFDLKRSAFWGTYLPYIQKKPMHFSLGDKLSIEDIFTNEQINKLAISEIITSGDIAWLASSVVSEIELEVILRNQKSIETEIGNPSLRVLSNIAIKNKLASVLSKYNIQDSDSIAQSIVDEAKFWHNKIKG